MRRLALNLTLLPAVCLVGLVLCGPSLGAFHPKDEGAVEAGEPVLRGGGWEVYRNGRRLIYSREECTAEDAAARFFLHLYPLDPSDLPEDRRPHGYANLDFRVAGQPVEGRCLFVRELPGYVVARVRTGQNVPGEGNLWEALYLTPEAGGPVLRGGGWEVYRHGGRLIYSREGCTAEDTGARFFLHLVPVDASDLPESRRPHGYQNLDFRIVEPPVAGRCLSVRELPGYAIAEMRTGQNMPDGGNLWEALYLTPEAGEPILHGHGWEVRRRAGRLYYSREACSTADTAARFFLHLYPLDESDLPERSRPHGYQNLDFDFAAHQFVAGQCLAVRKLPGYALAEVRTGQVLPDAGRLWEALHLTPELGEPILRRGGWEVYHRAGRLYYSREACTAEDTAPRFFLHLYPVEVSDLPEDSRPHGYENLDFDFIVHQPVAGQCLAVHDLPGYALVEVRTGQYLPDAGRLWEALYLTPEAGDPILRRAGWKVYRQAGRLYYSREACTAADTAPRFFLHLYPVDSDDLPEDRRPYGYENLDFGFAAHQPVAGQCLAVHDLPGYPVAEVRTGQYAPDAGKLWEVRHLTPEAGEPILQGSGWAVHRRAGLLYYSREACSAADTAARFFLHLYPVDPDDLPEDHRRNGYENLDFDFATHRPVRGQCLAVRRLPGYAVAEVRTGQYLPDASRLWEARFYPPAPLTPEPLTPERQDP